MQGMRLKQVEAKVGLKKSKIHELIQMGLFPKPTKIGRASIWFEDQIDEALKKFAQSKKTNGRICPRS